MTEYRPITDAVGVLETNIVRRIPYGNGVGWHEQRRPYLAVVWKPSIMSPRDYRIALALMNADREAA